MPASLPPYQYALSNPVNLADPSGQVVPLLAAWAAGAAIGGVSYALTHPCGTLGDYLSSPCFWQAALIGGAAGLVSGLAVGFVAGLDVIGTGLGGTVALGAIGGAVGGVVAEALVQFGAYGQIVDPSLLAVAGFSGAVSGALFAGISYGVGKALQGLASWRLQGQTNAANPPTPRRVTLSHGPVDDILRAQPGVGLPGREGIPISGRPTPAQLEALTTRHGVEFAVTYKDGPGQYGGGGQYFLHSGEAARVGFPLEADRMLIYHTNPGGTSWAIGADHRVMDYLASLGSAQRISYIIPVGGGGRVIPFRGY